MRNSFLLTVGVFVCVSVCRLCLETGSNVSLLLYYSFFFLSGIAVSTAANVLSFYVAHMYACYCDVNCGGRIAIERTCNCIEARTANTMAGGAYLKQEKVAATTKTNNRRKLFESGFNAWPPGLSFPGKSERAKRQSTCVCVS